ncbi:MAG: cation diffusion facilitator family transporter [Candidatus Sericytochromatia bacterium]
MFGNPFGRKAPGHPHGDAKEAGHGHTHGTVDPSLVTTARGLWAVKWSFIGLMITAVIQLGVVFISGSVALLADTIHNVGDAATALPLGIAFLMARLKPTRRFPYGYGRVEDLAGLAVVAMILASAILAGYEAIQRLYHPQTVTHLWAVVAASVIGFVGNEAVAIFRIRVGKEIGSAALVADGYHARTDGLTSLAVLFGAIGVWLGFPLADPIVGLLITVAILGIVWESASAVLTRVLDGVDPGVLDDIRHAAEHVPGVCEVKEVRARWVGHRLRAEVNIAVDGALTVSESHDIAVKVHRELLNHLRFLSEATIHVDPTGASGESHHHAPVEHHADDASHCPAHPPHGEESHREESHGQGGRNDHSRDSHHHEDASYDGHQHDVNGRQYYGPADGRRRPNPEIGHSH